MMARGPIRAGYGTGAGRARGWMREEVRPVKQTEALEEVARLAARISIHSTARVETDDL